MFKMIILSGAFIRARASQEDPWDQQYFHRKENSSPLTLNLKVLGSIPGRAEIF